MTDTFIVKVCDYKFISLIAEGSFGKVFRAKDRLGEKEVAVKVIEYSKYNSSLQYNSFPVELLHEISILQSFSHENVVILHNIARYDDGIYLIFELMWTSLNSYIKMLTTDTFTNSHLKSCFYQIVKGVKYIHSKGIIHCDLSTKNIMINESRNLKISDFGCARKINKGFRANEAMIMTEYNRPPEILLGKVTKLNESVDCWGLGCIFGEMANKSPLFKARTSKHVLAKIFLAIGPPKRPQLINSPYLHASIAEMYYGMKNIPHLVTRLAFKLEIKGLDLIKRILVFENDKRMTGKEILNDRYFEELKESA
uniref:Protein kinase domain-containing protein n=1 Tax=Rhabditophanes sp. KR3021 TaxID=114890 RepID=A0AC35UBA5_9BILA